FFKKTRELSRKDWLDWKPYALLLPLLAGGVFAILIGSLLGIYLMTAILMVLLFTTRGVFKWLLFCFLGGYLSFHFYSFPPLNLFYYRFVAFVFIAFIFHPQRHFRVAAWIFFISFLIIPLAHHYSFEQIGLVLPIIGFFIVRKKHGAVIGSAMVAIAAVLCLNTLLMKDYPPFYNSFTDLCLGAAGGYMAYRRTDFSNYVRALLLLTWISLVATTASNPAYKANIFYNKNSLAYVLTTGAPEEIPKQLKGLQQRVRDVKVEALPVSTDRPLDYPEAPVRTFDPNDVRIGTSLYVLLHYAKLVIIPYPMSFYYGYSVIRPIKISDWQAILGLLIYLAIVILAVLCIRRNKVLSLGLIGYLLGIMPFANYNNLIPGVIADRYLLFPSIGFSIVIIAAIAYYATRNKLESSFSTFPPVFKFGFGGVLLILTVLTWLRNADWTDDLTLFRHDLKYGAEESAQGHRLLGIHLIIKASAPGTTDMIEQKQLRQEAVTHFRKTLKIYPAFFNAAFDLARAYELLSETDSAIVYYRKAISLNPGYTVSHLNIADIYIHREKFQEAIPYLEEALRIRPQDYDAYITLSNIYMHTGKFQEAVPYLEKAVHIRPQDYSGYDKLSFSYYQLKEYQKAIAVNRNAMATIPTNPEAVINLGRTYLGMNLTDSAKYYLQKADKMAPGNPLVQQLLHQLDH
ncbi:MAG: tetratricopeptide repeat protein, partial [Sphingobacteriales bacterium]